MPDIVCLKKIDSTNRYAIENFDSLKDRTLVTAESQTAGRGRRMKNWISPEGVNLYASFVIKQIDFNISISSWIGGLAALYTVRNIASGIDDFWIKWPNDVYCKDRKLAGVLCEIVSDLQNHPKGVIIGVGINVNMTKEQLSSIDKPATSLLLENGIQTSIKTVGEMLLNKMILFTDIAQQSKEELYKLWKGENKIVGKKVNVDILGRELINGKVVDIKPCGSLYLLDESGDFHTLYSGDVSIKSIGK